MPLSLEGTLPLNTRKLLNDLLTAFGAQGVSFACSVVMTLLVPKILGIEEFGYWQLFVFYTSYVSFFSWGLTMVSISNMAERDAMRSTKAWYAANSRWVLATSS